ncbi:MAG: hypothetical protein F8N15_06600 [Methanobacterium sp.]|nr:hypothetical protein [Methanobacterium sp.]
MASITGAGGSTTAVSLSSGHENVTNVGSTSSGSLSLSSMTSFAGTQATTQHAASTSGAGGNLVVHFQDGSSITVVGVNHIDTSFVH